MDRHIRPVPALATILALSALIGLSSTVIGQAEPSLQPRSSPEPETVDRELLVSLCSTNAATEAELEMCLQVVDTILSGTPLPGPDAPVAAPGISAPDLVAQLQGVVDDAVAAAQGTDVQAAIDAALAEASEIDVERLITDAIEGAGDAASQIDVGAILDDALAVAGRVDVGAAIDSGIETTRDVIAAAEVWVIENAETVCQGGSLGSGVAAAAVVGYLTGSPGLAMRAFDEVEKVARDTCAATPGVE